MIIEFIDTYVYFYSKTPFDEIKSTKKATKDKIKLYLVRSIGYDIGKKIDY
ncbi:hypothetical protein ALNOE001_08350 [Candidatus Methanobinarius endosymbioticus]|uniref:Uncharacterized protein n=1 Tax=Candidatus Methanobinarius endosymbioticus TaxID=2006182 RepID=A0A366MCY2_9EURY|nr:hypothetical protein ALNOE001_08350 [Candidatus Methanobinarius endosymbioticus]